MQGEICFMRFNSSLPPIRTLQSLNKICLLQPPEELFQSPHVVLPTESDGLPNPPMLHRSHQYLHSGDQGCSRVHLPERYPQEFAVTVHCHDKLSSGCHLDGQSSSHNVCFIAWGTGYGRCHTGAQDVNSMLCFSSVVESGRSLKIGEKQPASSSSSSHSSLDSSPSSIRSFTVSLLPQPPSSGKTFIVAVITVATLVVVTPMTARLA
ncbi:hypothetical protein PoB_007243300 [Plakobranchus ocellatus]|uniref:Uncharacterized protein n=1 Tax=Plakobranchus ocellatus TaxID=259542 RepID=A0AAV4DNP4_9GAST|nr:hypothetical protein PoB_007243300 [Plakobranchus ocellatus]